jgi:hypothetical protein
VRELLAALWAGIKAALGKEEPIEAHPQSWDLEEWHRVHGGDLPEDSMHIDPDGI